MPWRDTFLKYFGPGLLGGITFGDWLRLLARHRFRISPSCWPRASAITLQSLQNSFWRWREQRRYDVQIEQIDAPPPLFLLGHWRNGTTHLHNLLAVDERFAYPTNFEVLNPHTFLSTEPFASRILGFFLPKRRPMDNIEWTVHSPQEDEFALILLSGRSPCLSWVFPRSLEYYDRYLTFRDVPAEEIADWKRVFRWFVNKLTLRYQRPLLLKSPPHTARIRLLLELFPEARFVHIHRNPYAVFPSTKHTFLVNIGLHRLQPADFDNLHEHILRCYREMYDAFFDQRSLIPAGHYCEIGFEELERDPRGVIRSIYSALDLPDFSTVSPALERYIASIAGYQKNKFTELEPALRERINHEWRRSLNEWGYEQ
jgi:hypothetical protein